MCGKRKTSHSLAGRVAGAVCLVYCLSILVIFLCNFMVSRQMMLDDTQEILQEQLNYYESEVDKWVSVRMEHINILKSNFEGMTAEERTDEMVLRLLTESTNYGAPLGVIADYMVYPNDKMISGDGWVPEPGYKPTQNDYYKGPAESGKTYISTPYVDATTGEFIITISVPVYVNGKFYAVLGRDLTIGEVQSIAETYTSDDGSYLYLLDNENNILSHANPAYAPTSEKVHNVSELSDMKFLGTLAGKSGRTSAKDYDGANKYFLEKTNDDTGWTLGLSYPQQVIYHRLTIQMLSGLAIAVVALLIALPVLLVFLRKRLRPIQSVVGAARAIEQGNLDVSYEIHCDDEIGQLAETFRSTTDYLRSVIGEISDILERIAAGDLDVRTQCEYRGEFQKISNAITHIANTLNDVIGGIRSASEQVALGSGQVADGAQCLSQSSVEQAAQIDVLASSCDKVAQIAADNADKCRQAGDITSEVSQKLEQSNQQMREMTDAMNRISDSSNRISAVNKTIEDIAFQTNILALNAAVEAARAGVAGKGFAVVADEVRSLASKSAEAAQNTTELIDGSIKVVDSGAEISDSTAESLKQVLTIAQRVYEIMQEIVTLSQEQTEEINQIAEGIKEISGVVQVNSATAEESAAASRELSGQAQTMRDLVAHFRTR